MSKIFRIDWYPHQAHADYSRMDAEEIGLMSQLINLMYIHEGPIENDPKWICRSIKNMGSAKCRNIINKLLKKEEILLTPDGKLLKNMVQNQLKTVAKRRRNDPKSDSFCASIGGVLNTGNEQNQSLNNSSSTNTSTSTSTSTKNKEKNIKEKSIRSAEELETNNLNGHYQEWFESKCPNVDRFELRDTLIRWCKSKGKTYKDYWSALQNWGTKEQKRYNETNPNEQPRRQASDW